MRLLCGVKMNGGQNQFAGQSEIAIRSQMRCRSKVTIALAPKRRKHCRARHLPDQRVPDRHAADPLDETSASQELVFRIEGAFRNDHRIIERAQDLDLKPGINGCVVRFHHGKCQRLSKAPAVSADRRAADQIA